MTKKLTDPLALALADELKKFADKNNFQKAVLGLSGGVDSAVTLAIAVAALGAENITALILPQAGISDEVSARLAEEVAKQFEVQTETVEIGEAVVTLKKAIPWQGSDIADQNIAPRVRMTMLYHYARTNSTFVLGTSNQSELLLGYGTKHGDFAADVEVVGSLYKTDLYALAKVIGIPNEIIARPPTAELAAGVTDESELGASYEKLDAVLKDLAATDWTLASDADDFVQKILKRVELNKHKTALTTVLKV